MATKRFSTALSVAEDGVERLREEIKQKKTEIKVKFAEFRDSLDRKEDEVLRKLDSMLEEVERPVLHRKKMTERLIEGTATIDLSLQHNEFQRVRTETIGKLQKEIRDMENQFLDEVPSANLLWNTDLMDRAILEVCQITKGASPYKERGTVIMACGIKGTETGTLSTPTGVAIDEENGDIYIADCNNSRIQVFTNTGKMRLTIPNIDFPRRLIVDPNNIFVTCNVEGGAIFKINKTSPEDMTLFQKGEYVSDINFDHNKRLVGCVYSRPIVFVWDHDLKKVQEIQLHMPSFETGTTRAQRIVATQKSLIILFTNCKYPLQSFVWEGHVLKPILFQDELTGAKMFSRDGDGNFIVANKGEHEIKIFTPEGKLVCKLGKHGREKGEFTEPLCVALTNGRIVVLDMKEKCMLQVF